MILNLKKVILNGFIACVPLITGCSPLDSELDGIKSISARDAASMFTTRNAVIVDVREDGEWAEGHIAGAIHIPLSQLDKRLPELAQYKSRSVIMQCRSGKRSAKATLIAKAAGFSKVLNMDGGIQAWTSSGLTL